MLNDPFPVCLVGFKSTVKAAVQRGLLSEPELEFPLAWHLFTKEGQAGESNVV